MIEAFEYKGSLISDTSIPGEQKADGVMPTSAFGLQLSRDRWMLLSYTRGYTCVDDDRSIFYQIRAGSPVGEVLAEKPFSLAVSDWDPLGRGDAMFKVHGHATAFGVPKGARRGGEPYANENVFVAAWYTYPRRQQAGGRIYDDSLSAELFHLEQVHFRLNDAGDDIELIAPVSPFKAIGHDPEDVFPAFADGRRHVNHWIPGAVPFNEERTQWIEMAHLGGGTTGGKVAAILHEFNPGSGLYEWTRTGPAIEDPDRKLSEASVNRVGDEWIVCVRTGKQGGQTGWMRTKDPFSDLPEPTYVPVPTTWGPRVAMMCPDGVLRVISGDIDISPYGEKRNPLYMWDVDPIDFSVSNRRVIFDTREAGLPLRTPFVGFAKFFPHAGRKQLMTFRVTVPNKTVESPQGPPVRDDEIAAAGCYHAEITYDHATPEVWEFQ